MIDLNSGLIVDRYEKSDLVLICSTFTLFLVKHLEKYEMKKKDERERLRLYRQRKRLGLVKSRSVGDECWAEEALLVSPRKKTKVINGLVKRYQIRVRLGKTRGRKQMVLFEEEKEWLLIFFDCSDITYINPGGKGNVYIGKENGIRRYVQKLRHLLSIVNGVDIEDMVVAETYEGSFCYELSFVSLYGFIKARKKFVLNRDILQGSCLCEVCENACLLAKGLNK